MTVVEEIVFTNDHEAGKVFDQDIAEGTLVSIGDTLTVKIAQPVTAPNVLGMNSEDATEAAAADESKMTVVEEIVFTNDHEAGKVFDQDIAEGTLVSIGDTLTVKIAQPVTAPNVLGMNSEDATEAAAADESKMTVVEEIVFTNDHEAGKVFDQDIAEGTLVSIGDTLTVKIAQPVTAPNVLGMNSEDATEAAAADESKMTVVEEIVFTNDHEAGKVFDQDIAEGTLVSIGDTLTVKIAQPVTAPNVLGMNSEDATEAAAADESKMTVVEEIVFTNDHEAGKVFDQDIAEGTLVSIGDTLTVKIAQPVTAPNVLGMNSEDATEAAAADESKMTVVEEIVFTNDHEAGKVFDQDIAEGTLVSIGDTLTVKIAQPVTAPNVLGMNSEDATEAAAADESKMTVVEEIVFTNDHEAGKVFDQDIAEGTLVSIGDTLTVKIAQPVTAPNVLGMNSEDATEAAAADESKMTVVEEIVFTNDHEAGKVFDQDIAEGTLVSIGDTLTVKIAQPVTAPNVLGMNSEDATEAAAADESKMTVVEEIVFTNDHEAGKVFDQDIAEGTLVSIGDTLTVKIAQPVTAPNVLGMNSEDATEAAAADESKMTVVEEIVFTNDHEAGKVFDQDIAEGTLVSIGDTLTVKIAQPVTAPNVLGMNSEDATEAAAADESKMTVVEEIVFTNDHEAGKVFDQDIAEGTLVSIGDTLTVKIAQPVTAPNVLGMNSEDATEAAAADESKMTVVEEIVFTNDHEAGKVFDQDIAEGTLVSIGDTLTVKIAQPVTAPNVLGMNSEDATEAAAADESKMTVVEEIVFTNDHEAGKVFDQDIAEGTLVSIGDTLTVKIAQPVTAPNVLGMNSEDATEAAAADESKMTVVEEIVFTNDHEAGKVFDQDIAEGTLVSIGDTLTVKIAQPVTAPNVLGMNSEDATEAAAADESKMTVVEEIVFTNDHEAGKVFDQDIAEGTLVSIGDTLTVKIAQPVTAPNVLGMNSEDATEAAAADESKMTVVEEIVFTNDHEAGKVFDQDIAEGTLVSIGDTLTVKIAQPVTAPNVLGMNSEDATEAAAADESKMTVVEEIVFTNDHEAGKVFDQDIAEGTLVSIGDTLTVKIAQPVTAPNVLGMNSEDATEAAAADESKMTVVEEIVFTNDHEAGKVFDQDIAEGTLVSIGDTLTVKIAQPVTAPNVLGMNSEDATEAAAADESKMTVVEEIVFTNDHEAGKVFDQDIAEGTLVSIGDTLTVKIAQPVTAPNVLGMNSEDATEAAAADESKMTVVEEIVFTNDHEAGKVFDQDIAEGTLVSIGDTLTVKIAQPVTAPNVLGMNSEDATEAAAADESKMTVVEEIVFTNDHEAGKVFDQDIAEGTLVSIGDTLTVKIAQPVTAPNVLGMNSEDATEAAAADESKMTVVEEIVFTNDHEAGKVFDQDIAEGTLVSIGDTLTVKIAQPVTAPNVLGMNSEDATEAAAADESKMTVVEEIVFTNDHEAGKVFDQDIAEGTLVSIGDTH